jgi:flagellar basal body-associated protein FliL
VYVTKEPEQADTFKYVLIVSIMVLILVVAIVMLCVFRYCLRKRNEEQIAKIQKVLKQDETINVDANDSNHPEAPNAAVPLEELTQYQMKTGKNADIDLIRSAATLKVQ